jgi:hypothetical protein
MVMESLKPLPSQAVDDLRGALSLGIRVCVNRAMQSAFVPPAFPGIRPLGKNNQQLTGIHIFSLSPGSQEYYSENLNRLWWREEIGTGGDGKKPRAVCFTPPWSWLWGLGAACWLVAMGLALRAILRDARRPVIDILGRSEQKRAGVQSEDM